MSNEEIQESKESANISNDAEELQQCESTSKSQRRSKSKAEDQVVCEKFALKEELSNKMFTYARETVCFCLALAFTALAVLHNLPPRISRPPVAKPFFNESSIILDFYKGHLNALIERVRDSDFSFVMYYAPWDAECQALKEEFESVAWYYHSQVFFAAINCWHPGSECRARYNKIHNYPVLMLYPSRESGIQYKGIRSAAYMIRFIHSFMNPITRITDDEQLMELLKSYDAVMIGYFRFSGIINTPGYKEFYRAAIRTLEKDPNREIVFVAITSPYIAEKHGVIHFPAASLLMWNETLFYPSRNDWTAEVLSYWVNNGLHRVVTWIQPPGSKSFAFAQYLWDGPVLFLFTPRNPLYLENDNYNLLREMALQYYDCSGNLQIEDVVFRLRRSRLEAAKRAHDKRERCTALLDKEKLEDEILTINEAGVTPRRWANKTLKCCLETPTNKCVMCASRVDERKRVCTAPSTACRGIDVFSLGNDLTDISEHFPQIDETNEDADADADESCSIDSCEPPKNAESSVEADPRSALSVKEAFYKNDCKRFMTAYGYHRPIFPRDSVNNDGAEVELTELICKINKTLALVAIDSLQYFHFAESLGINLTKATDKTFVIILDPDDESQFVMEEEFSRNTLANFINNYTNGYLRRTMRSSNSKRLASTSKKKCKDKRSSKICVLELSTDTFLSTVLDRNKDVVVMYHSPYCAFCSVVSYVYLTVAHYLSMMDHLIFVRIDGDNNDLPWEYTMNRYPSILFFPAKRKEDSTLFPWTLPMSVGNLLSFVLANLDEESHLEALINVCANGVEGTPDACLSRLRYLSLDVLESYLKELRWMHRVAATKNMESVVDTRKRILILKLQHVREVHLVLSTTNNLVKDKEKVKMLRKKFKEFYAKLANYWHDKAKLENEIVKSERNESKHSCS